MSEVILLHSSKPTSGGYSGVNASHIGDKRWKSTNDRNRILGAAAFMEARARVGKENIELMEWRKVIRELSLKSWHDLD